jgi:hypothetical protein
MFLGTTSTVQAQAINSGAPSNPFPHDTNTYAYGVMPSTARATMDAAVSQMYLNWYAHAVTSGGTLRNGGGSACAGCLRVFRVENGNDTVSEGIGYGMLIAVMMGDQTLFNGLYTYAKQWIPDTGNDYVMDWQLSSTGTFENGASSQNGATDADEDIAMALLMANKQWG